MPTRLTAIGLLCGQCLPAGTLSTTDLRALSQSSLIAHPSRGSKADRGLSDPCPTPLQRQNNRNVALLAPRKQFGKAKRLPDFLNLTANAFLFGGCSFGVRQHVAALESGAVAPHSKKWHLQGRLSAPEPREGGAHFLPLLGKPVKAPSLNHAAGLRATHQPTGGYSLLQRQIPVGRHKNVTAQHAAIARLATTLSPIPLWAHAEHAPLTCPRRLSPQ